MSRPRITDEDHQYINSLMAALTREEQAGSPLSQWHILRLALTASFQRPDGILIGDITQDALPSGRPFTFDWPQLTGAGKSGDDDYTDSVRALLSILHDVDLFAPDTDEPFRRLVEYHLHRGIELLQERWQPGGEIDPYTALADWLAETVRDSTRPAVPKAPERLADVFLHELGVTVHVDPEPHSGPRVTRYTLHLDSARDLDQFKSQFDKIPFILGLKPGDVSWELGTAAKAIQLDITRNRQTWQIFRGSDLEDWLTRAPAATLLPVCPGVDVLGEPFWLDLVKDGPHVMVAGVTGSGKSVCVHSLICSLIARFGPRELHLCLLDPKMVELNRYKTLPHLSDHGVLTEQSEIVAALEATVAEMERRYTLLESLGVRHIADARGRVDDPLPWLVVVVEELADLILQAPIAERHLVRLAQKARAAGIHLILATQRPDAETFTGLLRSNVDLRIALAVQRATESKIILDSSGAELLPKPGDMLIRRPGDKMVRVHGVLIDDRDIERIVRRARRDAT